jgi:hypothetical protein
VCYGCKGSAVERESEVALEAQNDEAHDRKALGPEECNPVAKGAEGGGKGHGVAEGGEGEDEAAEDCNVAEFGLECDEAQTKLNKTRLRTDAGGVC